MDFIGRLLRSLERLFRIALSILNRLLTAEGADFLKSNGFSALTCGVRKFLAMSAV